MVGRDENISNKRYRQHRQPWKPQSGQRRPVENLSSYKKTESFYWSTLTRVRYFGHKSLIKISCQKFHMVNSVTYISVWSTSTMKTSVWSASTTDFSMVHVRLTFSSRPNGGIIYILKPSNIKNNVTLQSFFRNLLFCFKTIVESKIGKL